MNHPLSIADVSVAAESSAAPPTKTSPSPIAALRALLFEHAFVPMALSALLCFAFWFTRVMLTRTATYDFLIKNLFLAWLPYFFSLAAVWMKRSRKPRSKWSIAAVWAAWLVTFPNAPYIFTDLIHWRDRPRVMPWWFDLGLVLMFGLAGCFAGIVSLKMMHDCHPPRDRQRRRVGISSPQSLC
jgi:hypothetical protein